MIIKRHKFKGLILMLGALFTLGLQPLLAQAKTTDVDSQFSVEMVETSDSKVGGEAVQVTVKNMTNQTGKHIVAKVDLPKEFADKLGKTSVTETVGTLAAGESKSFIISLSDGSLPATGERIASLALIVGLVLLMSVTIILHKRKLTGLLLALLVVTGGSAAYAATYNHMATHGHQVTVTGQTLAFKTLVSGDFESLETDKPTSAKHTLSFDLNYATSETLPSQELVANELASQPTAPKRLGYAFEGWYEKDADTVFDFKTPIQKDITLYAKWTAETYNITYELDGGDNYDNAPTTYTVESDTITLGTPTKANYVFDDWFSDAGFEHQVTAIANGSTGDITLYAKWTAIPYDITYELDGGDNYDNAPTSYTIESDTITLGTPTKTNYGFDGWFSDAEFKTPVTTIAQGSTGARTFYAKWTAIPYDITYVLDGGDNYDNAPTTYTVESDTITLGTPTKANYVFDGWFSDAEFEHQVTAIANGSTGSRTLYAKWTAKSYDITFSANGGTGGGASLTNYTYKESGTTTVSLTVPPTTPTGQAFDKWEITGGDTTVSDNTLTIKACSTGVISVKALWKAATFTVNFHNNSADTTDTTSQVIYDTPFSAPNPSKTGHTLEGWYQNVDLTGSKWDFAADRMPAHDLALYAKWTVIPYDITYVLDGGDNYDNAPTTYTVESDTITLGTPTKTNYDFDGWFSDAEFNTPVTAIANGSTGDKTLYAKWTAIPYDITYVLDGGDNYDNAPTTYTVESGTITLGEPSKSHYSFDGWFSDAEFNTPVTAIANGSTGDRTLYAKWTAIPVLDVTSTAPGSEFEFANMNWRILKTDMDDNPANGNQALVIRVNNLTNAEAGKGGTGTDETFVNFRDGNDYFSADGSNGYQAGADNSNYLKGAIDHYYTNYIANNPDYVKYVQAVDLHNPSYDDLKSGQSFSGSAYNAWTSWSDYYKDTRFKTTLGGAKQAFALSYGDIHTIAGVGAGDNTTANLNFSGPNNYFWLRSAGFGYGRASYVSAGKFDYNLNVTFGLFSVRPALSIQIQ